jgi:hypothetical protein
MFDEAVHVPAVLDDVAVRRAAIQVDAVAGVHHHRADVEVRDRRPHEQRAATQSKQDAHDSEEAGRSASHVPTSIN